MHIGNDLDKAFQDLFEPVDDVWIFFWRGTQIRFSSIVNRALNAESAVAFGIHLHRAGLKMNLEHDEIIQQPFLVFLAMSETSQLSVLLLAQQRTLNFPPFVNL